MIVRLSICFNWHHNCLPCEIVSRETQCRQTADPVWTNSLLINGTISFDASIFGKDNQIDNIQLFMLS